MIERAPNPSFIFNEFPDRVILELFLACVRRFKNRGVGQLHLPTPTSESGGLVQLAFQASRNPFAPKMEFHRSETRLCIIRN